MNKRRNSKTTTFSDTPIVHTCDESFTTNSVLTKFSEGLSPEGRLAMELAIAESKEAKRKVSFDVPVLLPHPGEASPSDSLVPSKENGKPQPNETFSKTSSSSDAGGPAEPSLPNVDSPSPSLLQNSRQKSFIDAYERTSSFRLEDDITSTDYKKRFSRAKRALDGGRFDSAMETVEIVKHGQVMADAEKKGDEDGEDTTQRNAVEKCLVWMEVTGLSEDNDPHP